jgi:hypothetical protein
MSRVTESGRRAVERRDERVERYSTNIFAVLAHGISFSISDALDLFPECQEKDLREAMWMLINDGRADLVKPDIITLAA